MKRIDKNIKDEMEEVNMGKIPENTTHNGSTKLTTLSVKLTAEENSRFSADLNRSGMSSKTDYVKQRLFNSQPIITLDKGHEIFEKLSECANLLCDLNNGNSVDRQQDIRKITEQLGKIESDIAYTWDCIDTANNKKEVD